MSFAGPHVSATLDLTKGRYMGEMTNSTGALETAANPSVFRAELNAEVKQALAIETEKFGNRAFLCIDSHPNIMAKAFQELADQMGEQSEPRHA